MRRKTIFKKTAAAVMAVLVSGGMLSAVSGGAGLLKPAIVAEAATEYDLQYAVHKLQAITRMIYLETVYSYLTMCLKLLRSRILMTGFRLTNPLSVISIITASKYAAPEVWIVEFDSEDVITKSNQTPEPGE